MAVPKCMLKGKELDDVREDFRTARRVEQYRLRGIVSRHQRRPLRAGA